jgi:peptidoglycan hydrolase CwlO-like protein
MQQCSLVLLVTLACSSSGLGFETGAHVRSNPLGKVLDLMTELAAKIVKEGEDEAKAYEEYVKWCQGAVQNTGFAIETATKEKGELEAKITELSSEIDAAGSKIEDLAAAISTNEADMKSAAAIRTKELADFLANEKELMEVIIALDRAIAILGKEMEKNPASFAQTFNNKVQSVLQSLSLVADAAAFSVVDRKRLLALAQSQTDQGEDEFGAPAAATYKSHSSGIMDVLEDMKEKAESQLAELRKAEGAAQHNYEMLKSSLEAQVSEDTKDMKEEKSGKAEAQGAKADAAGDLDVTIKELENSEETLATARSTCMKVGADHEMTVKAREEELKVIAQAKKILVETTSGAVEETYSFLQLADGSKLHTRADLAQAEVVVLVKRLARQHHSAALAQLASKVAAVLQYGSANGVDPFTKVKGLIQDMIAKLEAEGQSEAQEKAYCDEQMAKTKAKKEELDDDIAKLSVKIDQATSKSEKLKEDVQELESELAALTKLQAEMDKIRQETHADYTNAKADLEQGLGGVRKALGTLREYYGGAASMIQAGMHAEQPAMPKTHAKAGGAGQGIIDILEVVESDFATNLAKEETTEADAQSEYDETTQENKIAKTLKEQDVKYKTQEIKSLGKSLSELSADRQSASTEHEAVMEYYGKIKERCIAKPESYEERKKRREAEIAGLKQALDILENETAFMQRKHHSHMRRLVLS